MPPAKDAIVRAVRLDAAGNPIGTPFELVSGNGWMASPSLAPVNGGIRIAYSRVDVEGGGATVTFVRTLARRPVR